MKKHTNKTQTKTQSARSDSADRKKFAFFVGVDLGDKHCDLGVLDQDGELKEQLRLRMKGADLQAYFASIPRSRVAVEAGAQSRWVAELVQRCGHEVYVANTRKVPYICASDDKDDPVDALKLAELVHFKPRLLHPIQHRSQELQADLSWIRAREALVESRTQLVNTVRGISKAFGERLQRCSAEAFTSKMRTKCRKPYEERWRRCWR